MKADGKLRARLLPPGAVHENEYIWLVAGGAVCDYGCCRVKAYGYGRTIDRACESWSNHAAIRLDRLVCIGVIAPPPNPDSSWFSTKRAAADIDALLKRSVIFKSNVPPLRLRFDIDAPRPRSPWLGLLFFLAGFMLTALGLLIVKVLP